MAERNDLRPMHSCPCEFKEGVFTDNICFEHMEKFQSMHRAKIAELEQQLAVRPEVRWFALQMEKQLKANDHKPGWRDDDFEYLMQRLSEEVNELGQAHGNDITAAVEIIREAADVANFAMMVADNVNRDWGDREG